ncbi:DNA topoisomerase [Neptuniibacter sp. QD37_11]|uniref:DNA topoisomerase n=1 Tax=Neptuniibacter sp. QD37_11 TaxID=3398209 RepID=UPI0039F48D4B
MPRLMLCEKRDQAQHIANTLGLSKNGMAFSGQWKGDKLTIVYASGHLLGLQTLNEIAPDVGWHKPLELVPIPRVIPMMVNPPPKNSKAPSAQKYLNNIKSHLKGLTEFIIATDSDREGEAIGWEVVEHFDISCPIKRCWLAAGLDKKSILDATNNLREPHITKGWWRASQARNYSDWLYMPLTRCYTHYAEYGIMGQHLAQGKGRSGVVSGGRVQSCALNLCHIREMEIKNHVPVTHYSINCKMLAQGADYASDYKPEVTAELTQQEIQSVHWEPSRKIPKDGEEPPLDRPLFIDQHLVNEFKDRLEKVPSYVKSYSESPESKAPPKTFELLDAQDALSKACGISSSLAQTVFEDLYEQGWTSYARTSKQELPMNLYQASERNSMLAACMQLPEVTEQAKIAQSIHDGNHPDYKPFKPTVFVAKDMEHYGIVPTHKLMTPSAFSQLKAKKSEKGAPAHSTEHMQQAYLLVCKQFIQALYPAAKYTKQQVIFHAKTPGLLKEPEARFTSTASKLEDPGWLDAFKSKDNSDQLMPALTVGDDAQARDVMTKSGTTKPPPRFNITTFPKELKNVSKKVRNPAYRKLLVNAEGIGTPATRKTIIETLIAREYITVNKQGTISVPQKGTEFIRFHKDEQWLISPETTAVWEEYLVQICEEKDDAKAIQMRDNFVNKQRDKVEGLINKMNNTHYNNLGEKVRRTSTTVTPGKKNAIKAIAQKKGVPIPRGTLVNPEKADAFLAEHGDKNYDPSKLSEAQVGRVTKIFNALPADSGCSMTLEQILADKKVAAEFMETYGQYYPATPGQIDYANKLAANLPEDKRPDPEKLKYADFCSKFIDKNKPKGKPGSKGTAGTKGKPKTKRPSRQSKK